MFSTEEEARAVGDQCLEAFRAACAAEVALLAEEVESRYAFQEFAIFDSHLVIDLRTAHRSELVELATQAGKLKAAAIRKAVCAAGDVPVAYVSNWDLLLDVNETRTIARVTHRGGVIFAKDRDVVIDPRARRDAAA